MPKGAESALAYPKKNSAHRQITCMPDRAVIEI
jgi:hypothetical protein